MISINTIDEQKLFNNYVVPNHFFNKSSVEIIYATLLKHANFYFEGKIKNIYLPWKIFSSIYHRTALSLDDITQVIESSSTFEVRAITAILFFNYMQLCDVHKLTNKEINVINKIIASDLMSHFDDLSFLQNYINAIPINLSVKKGFFNIKGIHPDDDFQNRLHRYLHSVTKVSDKEIENITHVCNEDNFNILFNTFIKPHPEYIKKTEMFINGAYRCNLLPKVQDWFVDTYSHNPVYIDNSYLDACFITLLSNNTLLDEHVRRVLAKPNRYFPAIKQKIENQTEFLDAYFYTIISIKSPYLKESIHNAIVNMPSEQFLNNLFSITDLVKYKELSLNNLYFVPEENIKIIDLKINMLFGDNFAGFAETLKRNMDLLGLKITSNNIRDFLKTQITFTPPEEVTLLS